MSKQNPTVFISYAHESDMSERVKALADYLLDNGVQTITDHPYTNKPPKAGWTVWMQHNIEDADFVLVVCTARYKALFEKRGVADDGGRGVTWEGAILNTGLYEEKLQNSRIFPILPDDGEHSNVPRILTNWNNNHRFPSKNANILRLITEMVALPQSTQNFKSRPNGELTSDDKRLNPMGGKVFGRENECQKIVDFLNGDNPRLSVCGHVTGSAGIGKTEVCKAALKTWLEHSDERCFWVAVPDDCNVAQFYTQLGSAVGFDAEQISELLNQNALYQNLPKGLYYLDNLESIAADRNSGENALRELSEVRDIRLLASSRYDLDTLFGNSININRLEVEDAADLFMYRWEDKKPLDRQAVETFVDKELGGHALSIALLARYYKYHSWEKLLQLWQEKSTALEKVSNNRISSLEKSLSLTEDLLAESTNALDLWQFIALFDDGIDENILDAWQKQAGDDMAMITLIDHSLVTKVNDRYTLLPPMARYALNPQRSNTALTPHLDWSRAREAIYSYFMKLSTHASDTVSSEKAIASRNEVVKQFLAVKKCFSTDLVFKNLNMNYVTDINDRLQNTYLFSNIMSSKELLELINELTSDPLCIKILGDIELRIGNCEQAKYYYHSAFQKITNSCILSFIDWGDINISNSEFKTPDFKKTKLVEFTPPTYQKEKKESIAINLLKSIGDLAYESGNAELGYLIYSKALQNYELIHDRLGLANVLFSLCKKKANYKYCDDYKESQQLYSEEKDQLGFANIIKEKADLEFSNENLFISKEKYEICLRIYQKEKYPLGVANTLRALSKVEMILGNFSKGNKFKMISNKIYIKENYSNGLV